MARDLHALIIHGLNNSPEAMAPVAALLEAMGVQTTPVKLTGHWEPGDRLSHFKRVTPEVWLKDVEDAYRKVSEQNPSAKAILVANSLGALLGLTLAQSGRAQFEKMILLAPALFLRPWSYLPKFLAPFEVTLPSGMPAHVRANGGTPVPAYLALFSLVKNFDAAFIHAPALVMMDPRDELVSYAKVRTWAKRNPANRLFPIRNPYRFKHLLTAEEFIGLANWSSVSQAVGDFILPPTRRDNV